jgi:hypothetical protein
MTESADPLPPLPDEEAESSGGKRMPRIYIACPLTGLSDERKEKISFRLAQVKTAILDATVNERPDEEHWPVTLHVPLEHSAPWANEGLSPQTVYERNLDHLLNSDGLIVVTDETCSAGVGQEIEWAVRSGIPILYLSSAPVSKQICGIPHAIDVRICRDPETMSANVRNWLRSQRGPLLKGPNRRTDRHLTYVTVTAQIEVAWKAATNHSVVAAQLGLHPNAIWSMVQSPTRVALTPWWTICELAAALGVTLNPRRPLTYAESRAWIKAVDENDWDPQVAEQVRAYALTTQVADLELPASWALAHEQMYGSSDS